ncbi:DUF6484 domain-containing protein [Myxococcus sp. Y35]|uniref:DUF6484 domain-containing protein n=1 Tax=Pseudomyxococcus flavus TaxID=3115648 RepID=UPI003CE9EDB5
MKPTLQTHDEEAPTTPESWLAPRQGWMAGRDEDGRLLVDFPGNPGGPAAATLAMPMDTQAAKAAVARRQAVMLVFERADPRRPHVLSLVYTPSETPLLDSVLEATAAQPPEDVRVDGKPRALDVKGSETVSFSCGAARVSLQPQELLLACWDVRVKLTRQELLLQCGEASFLLQRNGRAVTRGVRIESHAEDTQRITGGVVEVN